MAPPSPMRRALVTSRVGAAALLLGPFAAAQSGAPADDCPTPSIGISEVAQRVAPDHLLQTGAAGDLLIKQTIQTICDETNARDALPQSCALLPPGNALIALRHGIILDLVAQVRSFERTALSPELRSQLRVASAVVNVVLSERSQLSFWNELATGKLKEPNFCGLRPALPKVPELPPGLDDALGQVGALLSALSALNFNDPRAIRDLAIQKLRELGRLGLEELLTPQQEANLASLVEEVQKAREAAARLQATLRDDAALRALLFSNLRSLVLGLALIKAPPLPMPNEALVGLAVALATGNLSEALTQLAAIAHVKIPTATLRRLELFVSLLRAETTEERERIIRREIFGFEPWPADYLVDAHIGALRVDSQTYKLAGDLLLGYNGRSWGVALRGQVNSYDLSNAAKIDTTDRYGGDLEAWLTLNPAQGLGLEGRLVLGARYNDTTVTDGRTMLDEQSTLGRGSLLAGLRFQRSRIAIGVWLGGGLQLDRYEPTVMSGNSNTLTDTTSDTIQGHATSRLRLQYHLVPDVLALRLAAGGDYFHLTRATVTTTLGGSIQVEDYTTAATHVDAYGRMYLDAEVARFFGFVPGIGGGFDLTYEDASGNAQAMLAPMLAVGIRRTSF